MYFYTVLTHRFTFYSINLAVNGGGIVGECGRLGQPNWLSGALYLLTYLLMVVAWGTNDAIQKRHHTGETTGTLGV